MAKTSVEWQELHGLNIYMSHLMRCRKSADGSLLIETNSAIRMAEMRIRELENKGV